MKRICMLLVVVGALGATLVTVATGPASAADKTLYYVSLGDSIAGGAENQYPDKLGVLLQGRFPKLNVIKLACPGESTASMTQPFPYLPRYRDCPAGHYPPVRGSQLDQAVTFLNAHMGSIALITITIGANDSPPGCDFYDLTCAHIGEDAINANLPGILAALRQAAGPVVPIIGMGYYPAGLSEWFEDPAAAEFWVDQALLPFNDVLESVYQSAGALVADVEGAFETTNFTIDEETGIPVNVEHICDWTFACENGDPHPNDTGHEVIAEAFEAALPA